MLKSGELSGGAHITGGGLIENPPRAIREGLKPRFDWAAWTPPPVFDWLAATRGAAAAEMRRTFNCGLGSVVFASPADAPDVLAALADEGAVVVGELASA